VEVRVGGGDRDVIEQGPAWNTKGPDRGIVCEGAVGAPTLGRFKLFRYEVRRWRNGVIHDGNPDGRGKFQARRDGCGHGELAQGQEPRRLRRASEALPGVRASCEGSRPAIRPQRRPAG
jgi:hypothetical protein